MDKGNKMCGRNSRKNGKTPDKPKTKVCIAWFWSSLGYDSIIFVLLYDVLHSVSLQCPHRLLSLTVTVLLPASRLTPLRLTNSRQAVVYCWVVLFLGESETLFTSLRRWVVQPVACSSASSTVAAPFVPTPCNISNWSAVIKCRKWPLSCFVDILFDEW